MTEALVVLGFSVGLVLIVVVAIVLSWNAGLRAGLAEADLWKERHRELLEDLEDVEGDAEALRTLVESERTISAALVSSDPRARRRGLLFASRPGPDAGEDPPPG